MKRMTFTTLVALCASVSSVLAADLSTLGQEQINQKDYASAVESFTKHIENNAKDSAAYVHRGYAYYYLKQLPRAERDFKEAIRLSPAQSQGYFNYGLVLDEQGLHEQAIAQYKLALKLSPNDASAYYNMGNSHSKLLQYKEAAAAFEQAVRLDPRHPYASKNLAVAKAMLKQ